jgi:carotenoid cleavage dioxygenase-like enzyme
VKEKNNFQILLQLHLTIDPLSHELADGGLVHKADLKFEEGKLIHDIGVTKMYMLYFCLGV